MARFDTAGRVGLGSAADLPPGTRRVLAPKRPGKAVVAGAVISGLQSTRLAVSRIVPHTYAYLSAEKFTPGLHDEAVPSSTLGGMRVVPVLRPLLHKGTRIPVPHIVRKPDLAPIDTRTAVIAWPIFATDRPVVDKSLTPDAPRTVVVPDPEVWMVGINSAVPAADQVALLRLDIGAGSSTASKADRAATLSLTFGEAEITARARMQAEDREVSVTFAYGGAGGGGGGGGAADGGGSGGGAAGGGGSGAPAGGRW